MAGEDAAGKTPASFEDEVRQFFDNIGAVLKGAGMSSSDVVSVQVYLTDGALFNRMNTKTLVDTVNKLQRCSGSTKLLIAGPLSLIPQV
jgi:enamine deaminase RidA (YjgF/YER057c/UK114 family)